MPDTDGMPHQAGIPQRHGADARESLQARAYWTVEPGRGEIRTVPIALPGPGEALVRSICSGISRGTEILVHGGRVPDGVADLMRAPHQDGQFPGPVKYGYLSVGVVEEGPADLRGRRVFCLYPHQDRYTVPAESLTLVPDDVPDHRAVLAGALETAVNALWDAPPRLGDRIAVVGAGMIGAAVAALVRRFPVQRLQLVDPDPSKGRLAENFGVEWLRPEEAAGECDTVFHCSSTEAGVSRGLELLGDEGELVEMSWYGNAVPRVPLGGDFHARRLSIRSSQVGAVAGERRARRTLQDRRILALSLLADPAFDMLISGTSPFEDLPQVMQHLSTGELQALCHVITYPTRQRA
jgi:NADPH:quinone reductase-like Zn-dependent oxidoreductase